MAIQYSDEVKAAMAKAIKDVEAFAQHIGMLCLEWPELDRAVDRLFEPLLQCSPAQVAAIISNVDSLASRCDIAKRLIVVEHPSPVFRDWLMAILDRTSVELAQTRNRYIHDNWVSVSIEPTRIDKRAKIVKEQSRQPPELRYDVHTPTSASDIDKLARRVSTVTNALAHANETLRYWRKTGQPQEPAPRWLQVSRPNVRYLTPQEHAQALEQGLEPSEFVED